MADGLDHIRPAGHGGVIIVTEEVIGDLGDLAATIGQAVKVPPLMLPSTRFIAGLPMKPATKALAGRS